MVPDLPPDIARSVASFFIAISDGYLVQWLLDPEATPSGDDLLDGARLATHRLSGGAVSRSGLPSAPSSRFIISRTPQSAPR